MKLLLVIILSAISFQVATAEQGTFVDEIQFIQYLDENTALEEVRNGNLDMYYFRISSDRIDNVKSREGLQVFESTGGSYSILVNPAESEQFNPFSIKDVRFALNYLVDRKLIVNELMGGYGTTMISNYGPFDPDYLYIVDALESFHFRYNPSLAEEMITTALSDVGAKKINGMWTYDGKDIELIAFIRSDDPVRKSIGEILSYELERIGFKVTKDFGDLNKAFVNVYGSNPADMKWSFYTEGWGGRSAFVKYDPVGLGQMYSPWFSNMPGFNEPSYWTYQNEYLDTITQKIYTGNFSSADERIDLFKEATIEGVNESVRIFLASKIDQYVVNEKIDGIINDLGAGVPTRFTPINARTDSDSLKIGVKQIYQAAWNPVMGISDIYSRQIWDTLYDPGVFKHPYTGNTFPIRTDYVIETAGSDGKLDVPDDAIIWDPVLQSWREVDPNTQATSKVTFDLTLSKWHNGSLMDMNDVLHSLYFTIEWGSEQQEDDKTFDTEFTPRASQTVKTLIGVRPLDEKTLEVYVDYWHFDEAEIADWASLWSSVPWELMTAMEQSVIDGKVSFSRSGAVSKSVNWLSLIVPNDAEIIKQYLIEFKDSNHVPPALDYFDLRNNYFDSRYDASIKWIEEYNHAVISNGPFYLQSYSPESRTITIRAFADESYPFEAGHWKEFENVKFPKIIQVDIPDVIKQATILSVPIITKDASKIDYFFTNNKGESVASGTQMLDSERTILTLTQEQTDKFGIGANDLKVFAVSESVLRPDIYSVSFLVTKDSAELPEISLSDIQSVEDDNDFPSIAAIVIGIIIVGSILYLRRSRKKSQIIRN
ncbi:MAG: ABC transporter substrate-binding protein [Thaumarchaeota archaeon]|nr:ABC transporter substrate-binding protein [Nitrososphaerota archaeon]